MSTYRLRVRKTTLHNASNDLGILLTSYLTGGTTNEPIYDADGRVDLFVIQTAKSLLPGSGYLAFLQTVATNAIATRYNLTVSGTGTHASNIITGIADTSGIIPGMAITGPGVPASSTIAAVLSGNSVQVSSNLTRNYTATTAASSIVRTGTTTSTSFNITVLAQTSDLTVGMLVTGSGVPVGSTITTILSGTSVAISMAATASAATALTFSPNPASTTLTSVSPAELTSSYVPMGVTGTNISTDTSVRNVLSASSFVMTNNATAGGATSISFTGPANFAISTSNWTFDFTDLQKVVNEINFGLL